MVVSNRLPVAYIEDSSGEKIPLLSPGGLVAALALDPDADYFIYCRSGNRSGQAIVQMSNMGFSSMTNGGSVSNASSLTGIPVVVD